MFGCGRSRVLWAMAVLLAVAVMFTGCKKKSDDAIIIRQPDVGGPHFYTFDLWGDLFDIQINEGTMEYSYKKILGPAPVGIGKGDLTAAGFGPHAYYDEDNAMWSTVPNKVLAMGGDDHIMVGVPITSTAYVASEIAGMYNYLSLDYDTSWDEVSGDYGTLLVNADGTWEVFYQIDGTANPASAVDGGTWTDGGDGRISVTSNTFGKFGVLAVYPSANGNLLVMRYQYRESGDTYTGALVALEQNLGVGVNDLDATYVAIDWEGMNFDELVVSGTSTTLALAPYDTLSFDAPWTGMMKGGTDVYWIGSTDGILVRVEQIPAFDDGIVVFIVR